MIILYGAYNLTADTWGYIQTAIQIKYQDLMMELEAFVLFEQYFTFGGSHSVRFL